MVIDKVKNFCLKFDKVILFIFLCVVFIKSKPEHGLVISIAFVFAFLCVYLGYVQLRKFLFSGNKYSEKKVNLISAIPFSILFYFLYYFRWYLIQVSMRECLRLLIDYF